MAIPLTVEEKEKIKILKEEGLSYEKIGKRVDRSTMAVYRICNPRWVEDQMKTERIRSLAYYHKHRDERIVYMDDYRKTHKKEQQKLNQEYCATAHGRMMHRLKAHKRRVQKKIGTGINPENIEQLWENQDGKCAYCGKQMVRYNDLDNDLFRDEAHNYRHDYCNIDHVTPLSKGGLHEISNIVLACKACNMEKRARINPEFKVAI